MSDIIEPSRSGSSALPAPQRMNQTLTPTSSSTLDHAYHIVGLPVFTAASMPE
ncbi:hypothetical protein [Nocardia sp. A7]|uniref:hypothetical protein n=1 Tax=Nocardia sp. A7 TaxID=2789274 RepID=UPI00397D56B0